MAFKKHTGIGFPVPVLAQIKPKEFEILEKFEYRRTPDDEWTLVPKSDAYKFTDLASIPGVLLWLVPRFGRHTLAALLHDQLVKVLADRQETDSIFRDALGELKVPLLRRWIMWAGVSIGTVAARGVWGKVRIISVGDSCGGRGCRIVGPGAGLRLDRPSVPGCVRPERMAGHGNPGRCQRGVARPQAADRLAVVGTGRHARCDAGDPAAGVRRCRHARLPGRRGHPAAGRSGSFEDSRRGADRQSRDHEPGPGGRRGVAAGWVGR